MKIRCVLEEFFRSFRRSLFKNILLMPMFAISLVMTVIMCSYYFDMGDRYCELTQYKDDGAWYILQIENEKEIYNSFTTAKGCRNMMDYYEDFRRSFHMFSINTWQDVSIRETDMERIFGKRAYTDFLNPEQKKSYLGEFEEKEVCRQYSLNSILIDTTAFQTFGLRMAEGEGLTEQNTALERKTDPIPIVLGNGYQGILNVGDSLELGLFSYVYPCKIAGFLEKGAEVPESGDESNGIINLDSYILFPFGIQLPDTAASVDEIAKYAFSDFVAMDCGIVRVKDEGKLPELVNEFQEVSANYGLEPVHLMGASMGVDLLRNESATSIRVLLVLTIALFCFTFYGLFVTFYDKIQSNSRIYGIYLANGCSLGMILVSCLLEIAVILLPGILLSGYLFTVENMGFYNMGVILRAAYAFAGLAFLAGGIFVAVILRGVDTEQLMRQKE